MGVELQNYVTLLAVFLQTCCMWAYVSDMRTSHIITTEDRMCGFTLLSPGNRNASVSRADFPDEDGLGKWGFDPRPITPSPTPAPTPNPAGLFCDCGQYPNGPHPECNTPDGCCACWNNRQKWCTARGSCHDVGTPVDDCGDDQCVSRATFPIPSTCDCSASTGCCLRPPTPAMPALLAVKWKRCAWVSEAFDAAAPL